MVNTIKIPISQIRLVAPLPAIDRVILYRIVLFPTFHYEFAGFDKTYVQRLCEDIKINGLKEPIVVYLAKDGIYEVSDGQHRFEVCKILGYKTIPCIIKN